eukprot:4332684-Alexandrium_andersonii.AAC.1
MTAGQPPPASELQGLGVAKRFVGSLESQASALEIIESARQSVRVMAFTSGHHRGPGAGARAECAGA